MPVGEAGKSAGVCVLLGGGNVAGRTKGPAVVAGCASVALGEVSGVGDESFQPRGNIDSRG